MTAQFIQALDTEAGAIEQRQIELRDQAAEIVTELKQLEARHEKVIEMRAFWNGDLDAEGQVPTEQLPAKSSSVQKADKTPAKKKAKPKPAKKKAAEAPATGEKDDADQLAILDVVRDAAMPVAASRIIREIGWKKTPEALRHRLNRLIDDGRLVKTGQRAGTRYSVPGAAIATPEAKRKSDTDRSDVARERRGQILAELASGPKSMQELRTTTGLGQGAFVQVMAKLKESGAVKVTGLGSEVRYSLATQGASPSRQPGTPAPPPLPARTELQDRIFRVLSDHGPMLLNEIWTAIGANPLKVENAVEALKKRGEIQTSDAGWAVV